MNQDISSTLNALLEIIDYPIDKESFVQQFQEITLLEAMLNIYEKLPLDTQQKIKTCENDPEKMKQYIPVKLYKTELQRVTEAALKEFVSSISMKLVPAQKRKIAELLKV